MAAKLLRIYICFALFALQLQLSAVMAAEEEQPTKVGAGLLLCAAGKVLLLQRDSQHNDNTWAIPGGNVEDQDEGLLSTATREALEEMGQVPPFEVKSQILTKRGKRSQKHYTVFVADVDAKVARDFVPELDLDEHKVWKWVPWADVLAAATGSNAELELHPVVAALASQHANDVHSASQMCTAAAAAGGH